MTTHQTQLEANHELITEGLVATLEQETHTEMKEDTSLFRDKLQKVFGVKFIAAATKEDTNMRPLLNFVKKCDWDSIKIS